MGEGARKTFIVAVTTCLLAYVYGPLLGVGPFGRDLALATALSEIQLDAPEALYTLPGIKDRPLAALSLILSRKLWVPTGAWYGPEITFFRLENLGLLLLAAFGLRKVLSRSLVPFLGPDSARSASVAAALFFVLHPLAVSSVARATERGELIAMAAGLWGLHLFLRARQDREYALVAAAGLLFTVAAFAGRVAVFLPPLVFGLEFLSARRHRPKSQRIRTATTAFLLAALLVGVERAWRLALSEPGGFGGGPSDRGALDGLALWVEKLGVLLLPVDTYGAGKAGFALVAVTHLVALHPGFVAARTAPRLWGRILVGWTVALLVVETTCAKERVLPGSLEGAEQLFPALLVMAVGLGITSTAIQGARRTLIPVLVCGTYALLGHGHAGPFGWAGEGVGQLRDELAVAAQQQNWKGRYLVVDPPDQVAGVEALRGNLALLMGPAMQPEAPFEDRSEAPWAGGADWEALAALAPHGLLDQWREDGLSVLMPAESGRRIALVLPEPGVPFRGAEEPRDGGTPRAQWALDVDPFEMGYLAVQVPAGARTGEPPVVRWEALAERPEGELFGVWVEAAGGVEARFCLTSSRLWLLSERVLGIRFPGALSQRTHALAAASVPSLPDSVVPRRVGDDWLFDVGGVDLAKPLRGDILWILSILDPGRMELQQYVLGAAGGGKLRATGLALRADELTAGGAELLWSLEPQIEGVALARALGRR